VWQLSGSPYISYCPGNIPSYSYLEDKAFRHGDIEDVIGKLAKALGGGFFGRSSKFTPLDVKRVYFGNWLRDCEPSRDLADCSRGKPRRLTRRQTPRPWMLAPCRRRISRRSSTW
jgi:hypothetical protein